MSAQIEVIWYEVSSTEAAYDGHVEGAGRAVERHAGGAAPLAVHALRVEHGGRLLVHTAYLNQVLLRVSERVKQQNDSNTGNTFS